MPKTPGKSTPRGRSQSRAPSASPAPRAASKGPSFDLVRSVSAAVDVPRKLTTFNLHLSEVSGAFGVMQEGFEVATSNPTALAAFMLFTAVTLSDITLIDAFKSRVELVFALPMIALLIIKDVMHKKATVNTVWSAAGVTLVALLCGSTYADAANTPTHGLGVPLILILAMILLHSNKHALHDNAFAKGVAYFCDMFSLNVSILVIAGVPLFLVSMFTAYIFATAELYIKPALNLSLDIPSFDFTIPAFGKIGSQTFSVNEGVAVNGIIYGVFALPAIMVAFSGLFLSRLVVGVMSQAVLAFDDSCNGLSAIPAAANLLENAPSGSVESLLSIMILSSVLIGLVSVLNMMTDSVVMDPSFFIKGENAKHLETLLDGVYTGFAIMFVMSSIAVLFKQIKRRA